MRRRTQLNVYGFDPRAIAMYRRAGFLEEGGRREAMWRSRVWHDEVTRAILYAEWQQLTHAH